MSVGDHPAGSPCWAELGGPADPVLREHYAALLGWEYDVNENVAGYVRAFAGREKVAGLGGPPEPAPPRGWRVYLATDDLDRALGRWRAGGGRVGAVHEVHDGRFGWLQDPWGTDTGLFESTLDPGTSTAGTPGCVAGWEIVVPEPDAALKFYTGVCGAEFARSVRVVASIPATDAGEWVVEVHAAVPGPVGDVPDPAGNVLRLIGPGG